MLDLSLIWAGVIALGVLLYIVLDGFDLGIGILFTLFDDDHERNVMVNTIAPVWDGNETWLVLGGAGLFAAFPVVYAAALSALYLPLVLMLACLIFRGAAFELRGRARRSRHAWDLAFCGGSAGAAFFQGVVLGAWISGFPIVNREYAGGPFDWLTAFNLFVGLGVVLTYTVLGCGWLIYKTEGDMQRRLFKLMSPLIVVLLGAVAIVSAWTPLHSPQIAQRWFSTPNLFWFLPVPVVAVLAWFGTRIGVKREHPLLPFAMSLLLVFLGYSGLLISLWPNLVPPSLTIWQAAAPRESQAFALVGVAIVLPVILAYTAYAYWVFRGKVRPGDAGYH
ncbi:cytochrome d ubiquinol oxidase subunit II [Chitinasiproducens palmae]|uniref:Cytochrome bd-I ubiquinol oxidase subunit 2 apoprotein n=1 Tax=Chitinasiproducens palmae TaxID=1770053 RepID=A0A1H2PK28_9BURK|nr:cytochrome d ubiquinol oxidase subunit II [Chitinasiproducens palmae]SDV46311.1 cytochrome bd-I ubiquinol oxidase subunit 2 apoprotein [Chitinasiproducens palmae]